MRNVPSGGEREEAPRERLTGARITIILDPSVPGVAKARHGSSSTSFFRRLSPFSSFRFTREFFLSLGEAYSLRFMRSFFNLLFAFFEFLSSRFSDGAPRLLAIILLALFVSSDCTSFYSTPPFFSLFLTFLFVPTSVTASLMLFNFYFVNCCLSYPS